MEVVLAGVDLVEVDLAVEADLAAVVECPAAAVPPAAGNEKQDEKCDAWCVTKQYECSM